MENDAGIVLTGVRIVSASCDAAAVIAELGGAGWRARARVIKRGDRGMVAAGALETLGGREVVIKTHRLRGTREVVAAALGRSRLARQARGAALLEAAGVETARVELVARGTDARGRRTELLVLDRVRGVSVAHHAHRRDLAELDRRALAHDLGAQIHRIAAAGLMNRDHKASNIVVGRDADGELVPVVVDTVGVRRSHPAAARVRMLFGLTIELVGLGILPALSDRMRIVRAAVGDGREARKRAWRAVDALVRIHGDATPKDDPVGEPEEG